MPAVLLILFVLGSNAFFLFKTNPMLLIQMGLSLLAALLVSALAGLLLWPVSFLRHRGGRIPERGEHLWTRSAGIVTGAFVGLWCLTPLLIRSDSILAQLPGALVLAGYGFAMRRWAKARQYVPLFSTAALVILAAVLDCVFVLRHSDSALLAGDRWSRQLNTVPLAASLAWAGWRLAWAWERSPVPDARLP